MRLSPGDIDPVSTAIYRGVTTENRLIRERAEVESLAAAARAE
ncbi:hypothetical protein [Microbacterium sp.]